MLFVSIFRIIFTTKYSPSGAVGPTTVFQLQMAVLFPASIGAAVESNRCRSKIIAMWLSAKGKGEFLSSNED